MAVFTSAQAKAVIVKTAEKTFYPDSGSFKEWIFVVEDGKGNVYEWVETSALLGFTPSSSARVLTPSQIGNYIHAYLSGGLNAAGSASYTGVTKLSSDLTNTIPSENGGTEISIHNIVSELSADGGTSNGLCTISFSVRVQRWGTESLTLDLDLDKLVSTS